MDILDTPDEAGCAGLEGTNTVGYCKQEYISSAINICYVSILAWVM